MLYNKRHVTGSPLQLELFDPQLVKLESAETSGVVGDEMSLDSTIYFILCLSVCLVRYVSFVRCTKGADVIFVQ